MNTATDRPDPTSSSALSGVDPASSFFASIEPAPPDAILGLNEAFKHDPNPEKINLTVGVYQNELGQTPIFECIREAAQRLMETEKNKSYLGIAGLPNYTNAVQKLLFGENHSIVQSGRACTVQSPGGTGALRIAADFIRRRMPESRVWFSQPTWANHPAIFSAAGMLTENYDYLDSSRTGLDFEAMKTSLESVRPGDVVVLHGCCHNPTGVDLTPDHWSEVASLAKSKKFLPLIDCAYQGFHRGLDEDVAGIRILCDAGLEVLVCSSFSKNLGLYGERVGALTVVTPSDRVAGAVVSHVKSCIRVSYSNPPRHGASLAATVLNDPELTASWHAELAGVRQRIRSVRGQFVAEMNKRSDRDFSFIEQQNGMFSFSGLTPLQVDQLRQEHSIYIVGAGRINVAGINDQNIARLCDCIASVL